MKSTLVTFALAMTVAEAQWTENVYGRRTARSSTGTGGWGPSTQQKTNNFSGQSGNWNGWNQRQNAAGNGWGSQFTQQPSSIQSALGTPTVVAPVAGMKAKIEYVKVPLPHGPVSAAAEMWKDEARGLIVLSQQNEEAVKIDIRLAGLQANTEYELKLMEYGNILSECSLCGKQFNPLYVEPYTGYDTWGRPINVVPEKDGRGEIESFKTNELGEVTSNAVELLQNLSGDENLIGKSITLYEKDDSAAIMCGVIGHGLPSASIISVADD